MLCRVAEEDPKASFKIWDGVYTSFRETGADGSAFQDTVWLDKLAARVLDAKSESAGGASVAAVTETRDYVLPVIAAATARRNEVLRVLDFGGGSGTSFFQLAHSLSSSQPLDYVVIDNEEV